MTGCADFEDFVVARRFALLRTAYLFTGDHHAAEDLVQSALIEWCRSGCGSRPPGVVRPAGARPRVGEPVADSPVARDHHRRGRVQCS